MTEVDNKEDNKVDNKVDNSSNCEPITFGIILVVLAIAVLPFTIVVGVCVGTSYLIDYIKFKCKKTNVESIKI